MWTQQIFSYILFLSMASCNNASVQTVTPTESGQYTFASSTLEEPSEYTHYLPLVLTPPPEPSCSQSSFGTMLVGTDAEDWISPDKVMLYANEQLGITGLVATGSPSEDVREEWFGNLTGWTRSFIRGTYDQLLPIETTATIFSMQDMYECIGYGPESAHQAAEEALDPLTWVPLAEAVAESAGKCLIYGPAVLDYEAMATPTGEDRYAEELLGELIAEVSPHVDMWMIQLAKYQRWTDSGHDDFGNPYTIWDFRKWVTWWVTQIKSANPEARVWTQLGIGIFDPMQDACLPPQPPEYILDYRRALAGAGVEGVFVMPSQPCQESTDPLDHEHYLQSLFSFQQAMELACSQ